MDSLKGTLTPMKVLNGTLNGGIAYGTFNYNELENKPSVNGTELVGNVNIPIPTKTSDLTNDSGFITDADVPTKTSDLTNDSGFITDADIPTKTSELTNDSGFITEEDIPEIPTNTSQLNNDSGFLTMNTTPVRSVNSQTGDVNLFIPNATSQLNNDAGFLTESSQKITDIEGDVSRNEQNIGDLTTLDTSDKSSLVGAVNEVNASKMTMLRLKQISITGATGTAWTPHYYKDIDISSYFTGADANAVIIGVIINQQTSGGVLCAMLQGTRTIRLLNDQAFTNVTCNITCLYYRS